VTEDRSFHLVLRQARIDARITQRELAKRLGQHPTAISRVERGDFAVTELWVRRYADALGLEVWLVLVPH
jgi:transcriptional regulator with XRE-family HTH domain